MSYTDATARPAQGFEVVEKVVDLIQGIAALTTAIGSSAYVYEHRTPEPPGGQWKRIVVRLPIFGVGSRVAVNKVKGQRFDVMAEVNEAVEKPDQWLAQAHDLIYQGIVNQGLTLTRGESIGKILPYSEPTAAGYDADDKSFYSKAGYVLVMSANTA